MEETLVPYATSSTPKIFVGANSDIAVVHDDNTIVVHKNIRSNGYDDDFFNFPPGFRFCPFDEELISCYLKKKVMKQTLPPNKIHEVNLYKFSPWELSVMFATLGEKEWYFFTPRDRKYRNGARPNRAAGSGFWKATGADKPIKNKKKEVVGYRKALVFYEGKPPKGVKTNWIMHEFRVEGAPSPRRSSSGDANDMRLDEWVLCRIYNKVDRSEKKSAPKRHQVLEPEVAAVAAEAEAVKDSGVGEQSMVIQNEDGAQFSFLSEDEIMQGYHYQPACMEYENQPLLLPTCGASLDLLYSSDLPAGIFITKNDMDDSIQEYMMSMDSITNISHP